MAEWRLGKLGNHEYGIVNLSIALTWIVIAITCLLYANTLSPLFALTIFAITTAGSLLILALVAWERTKNARPERKYEDERSDACSLKATRNAFIVAMVVLALIMMGEDISSILGNRSPELGPILAVWGVTVAVYTVSWYYYIRSD